MLRRFVLGCAFVALITGCGQSREISDKRSAAQASDSWYSLTPRDGFVSSGPVSIKSQFTGLALIETLAVHFTSARVGITGTSVQAEVPLDPNSGVSSDMWVNLSTLGVSSAQLEIQAVSFSVDYNGQSYAMAIEANQSATTPFGMNITFSGNQLSGSMQTVNGGDSDVSAEIDAPAQTQQLGPVAVAANLENVTSDICDGGSIGVIADYPQQGWYRIVVTMNFKGPILELFPAGPSLSTAPLPPGFWYLSAQSGWVTAYQAVFAIDAEGPVAEGDYNLGFFKGTFSNGTQQAECVVRGNVTIKKDPANGQGTQIQ